jgi:hypothetical protein
MEGQVGNIGPYCDRHSVTSSIKPEARVDGRTFAGGGNLAFTPRDSRLTANWVLVLIKVEFRAARIDINSEICELHIAAVMNAPPEVIVKAVTGILLGRLMLARNGVQNRV